MSHVTAFGDDALGDLDAVAMVDAMRTGKVSSAELVDAAIALGRATAVTFSAKGVELERALTGAVGQEAIHA